MKSRSRKYFHKKSRLHFRYISPENVRTSLPAFGEHIRYLPLEEVYSLFATPENSGIAFRESHVMRAMREIIHLRMKIASDVMSNSELLKWYFRDRHPITFEPLDTE